jgi:hypothetical protein
MDRENGRNGLFAILPAKEKKEEEEKIVMLYLYLLRIQT